jgi:hypothetical protein
MCIFGDFFTTFWSGCKGHFSALKLQVPFLIENQSQMASQKRKNHTREGENGRV